MGVGAFLFAPMQKGYTMQKSPTLFAEFARYAGAQMAGMLGLSLYILADTFFISLALGTAGLAALNLALPVYNAVSGVGMMLGVGASIAFAVTRGRGESDCSPVRAALLAGLAFAACCVTLGLTASAPLARLLGADDAVFAMTETYLRVILLFSLPFISNQILQAYVRTDGNPRLSMLAMLGGSAANIVLDYLFMFPLGMGMFGAVLATGFAPIVSMLILAPHFRRGRWRGLLRGSLGLATLPRTAALGLPAFVAELSAGVVIVAFNAIMLRLGGNTAVAAYGVIANLAIVTTCLHNGIAQGVQPLLGRAHGASDSAATRRLTRYACLASLGVAAILYAVIALFAEPITAVFNTAGDAALRDMALPGLRLYFTALFFAGLNTVAVAALTAAERPLPAQLLSVARGIAVILPVAVALSAAWGITGAWLAYPVSEAAILAVVALGLGDRKRKK